MTVFRWLASATIFALLTQTPAPQTPPAAQAPPAEEFKDLAALMASLPKAMVKPLDPTSAVLFSSMPLSCLDDLQDRPTANNRPYFWQPTYRTVENYERVRAFYGCNDWTTAVSSTWTLVALLKKYPDLSSGELIREKLTAHLGRENLEGELAYFRTAGNAQRPYGYAWFLKLYAELATWKDPDGLRYADNATALSRFFSDGIVAYLAATERPTRAAGQTNSALTLNLLIDYADITKDATIKRVAGDAARRWFLTDTNCTTGTEAASPEMLSPCLEEAAAMSRVLDATAFTAWFDKFLPAAQSNAFKPLRSINFEATGGRGRGGNRGGAPATPAAPAVPPAAAPPAAAAPGGGANSATNAGPGRGGPQTNPRTNWIGLAFTRASSYSRLAASLPAGDPRVAVFKRLSEIHVEKGQQEIVTPAAFDAPWIGAFAVSYLTTAGGAR